MVKMVRDLKLGIEYLWDDKRKEPYKKLVNFHLDGTATIDKIYYQYTENFSKPYEVSTILDDLLPNI